MAVVTRYVNTASTAGGNGTTNATSGDNRAYATLSEWEAAEGTDLVTDGDTHRVLCSGGADSTAVSMNGFTTDATHFVTIEGEWDASTGRFDSGLYHMSTTSARQLTIFRNYTVVDKMQFDGGATAWQGGFIDFARTNITFKNSCFYDMARSGVSQRNTADDTVVENCLIYDTGRAAVEIEGTNTDRMTVYNCTAYNYNTTNWSGGSFALQNANGQIKVVNSIGIASSSSTQGDFEATYTLTTGSDYNASSDTSAPGANSIHSITDTTEFVSVTGGSEDFHLDSGSTLLGDGIGPSSDSAVPTTDIDGDTRSGTTTDIGFDLYVGGGGGGGGEVLQTESGGFLRGLWRGFN